VTTDGTPAGSPPPVLPAAIRERQRLATAVLTVCAVLEILALASGPYPHDLPQRLLLALLACGPIVLLQRWPLPVLAVATAAGALVVGTSGVASTPLSIMIALALYFVASRLPRQVSIRAALATAGVLAGALGYAALTRAHSSPGGAAVLGLLWLSAGWFVGDSVATRRRYLAGLAEQAQRERAAEAERARQQVSQERIRIARELHDVVAHTLAVMTVQAGVGRRLMGQRPEEAAAALESIEAIGRTAQDELRVVLGLLRDQEPGAAALAPAPRLADLSELADTVRASGTPVELRMSGTDREFSPALELSVYRVVQEALTNVVKHAPHARATVDLSVSAGQLRLQVADDGGAPEIPPATAGAGQGIVGMRERMAAFGGWLVAEPVSGRGFRVLAEVPAGDTG
jgi:signal transduction histidine kinase